MLKPIHTEKIYKLIIDQIRSLIDENQLQPGDKLPSEREIAAALSVSRTSVRHAIATLVAKGLLSVQQGGGTFIAEPKRQIIDKQTLLEELCWNLAEQQISPVEISQSRLLLEVETVRLCALNADEATCTKLTDLLERNRIARGEAENYESFNRDFHMAVAEGSGNIVYLLLMKTILQLMQYNMWPWAKTKTNDRNQFLEKHLDQHEAIVQAIVNHDPESASAVMQDHLSVIEDEMKTLFEQSNQKNMKESL
jgi:DNA-binding FadR family transcriptional regulator